MLLTGFVAAALATSAPAANERAGAVIAALNEHLLRKARAGVSPSGRYGIAFDDLNKDGHEEAVVYLLDNDFCGSGGCMTFVFRQRHHRWSWVSTTR